MWSSNSHGSRFRREDESDVYQLSPCLTASSGLLTPPGSYNIDARRGSTASLSTLGPTTPVYGRNPFSDHGFQNVANMEPCHEQSMDSLAMSYPCQAPGQDAHGYDGWTHLAPPTGLDHTLSMRVPSSFVAHQGMPMEAFTGVDTQSSSAPVSCNASFSSSPYADYSSQLQGEAEHVQTSGGMWPYQYALANMIAAPTMTPNDSLLSGEYVKVDAASHDTDMTSYDDMDVPLAQSPYVASVKQEDSESMPDEAIVTRSIWVSSTGGKSVKKEGRPGISKKKSTRKAKSKAVPLVRADGYEMWVDGDLEQIPSTGKWRRNGGNGSGKPQICQIEVSGIPCGRKFLRQEHLHRHMKTHSGRKDFVCQLCLTQFNRNDNCWEHYWTHVHRPGKKNGRNKKHSLKRVLTYITDPKHTEKLLNKWQKEVGFEYDPQNDIAVLEEEQLDEENADSSAHTDDSKADKRPKCVVRSRL